VAKVRAVVRLGAWPGFAEPPATVGPRMLSFLERPPRQVYFGFYCRVWGRAQ
jgi:hypothetical protein